MLANAVDQSPALRVGAWVRQQAGSYNYSFAHYLRCPLQLLNYRPRHFRAELSAGGRHTSVGAGLLANAVDQSPPSALAIGFASKPAPTNYSSLTICGALSSF